MVFFSYPSLFIPSPNARKYPPFEHDLGLRPEWHDHNHWEELAELIKPDTVKGFTVGPQSVMHFLPWFSALRFDSKIYNTFFSPSYLTPTTGKQTLFGTQVVSGQLSKRSWLGP